MHNKKYHYKETACSILATNMEARSSIRAFHEACLKEVYGQELPAIRSWEDLTDLLFGGTYNFYTWDRARIWAQTQFPYYNNMKKTKEAQKETYKEFAKKPLEPLILTKLAQSFSKEEREVDYEKV